MDLLESVLHSSNFDEYSEVFKQHGIDSYTLKILTEDDIELLGVQDEEKRKHFLKVVGNLQIPTEKKISIIVDKNYIELVLHQMSFQFQKQMANLIYILKREDVDMCDIELKPAVECLQNALQSFEHKLGTFERKVLKVNKRKRRKPILISSLLLLAVTLGATSFYFSLKK